MKRVLIVGAGFAGKMHAEAWRRLGYEVAFYDVTCTYCLKEAFKLNKPDIVDFCDTPKTRINYIVEHINYLEDKEIYVEKPPCRPQDLEVYRYLCKCLNITPIHNYLFMPLTFVAEGRPIEVVILRNGPHKGWYADVDLSGGGILLDHGYHWLYVADQHGVKFKELKGWVDGYPDLTACVFGDNFKFYATWKSPVRLTVINGQVTELRTKERMVESLIKIFNLDKKEKAELRLQSIRVMEFISKVYGNVSFAKRDEL